MKTKKRDIIFKAFGWVVVCESPYEIQHDDGSFVSGQAAYILETELLNTWKDYLNKNKIKEVKKELKKKEKK